MFAYKRFGLRECHCCASVAVWLTRHKFAIASQVAGSEGKESLSHLPPTFVGGTGLQYPAQLRRSVTTDCEKRSADPLPSNITVLHGYQP